MQIQPKTKDEFWAQYWFTPLQLVKVINPQPYDYEFKVEGRSFVIKAGTSQKYPGNITNVYLSNMSRIKSQEDDKMQFMSDFALMEQYYKALIVEVEELVQTSTSVPEYLRPAVAQEPTGAPETPPWQAEAPQEEVKVEEKEEVVEKDNQFELNGVKYKYILTKNGKKMYYKNGQLTNEAEYSKAASMI